MPYPRLVLSLTAVVAGFILFFAAGINAADEDFFTRQDIEYSGQIIGVRHADFNGDGLVDLAVITADNADRRFLNIHLQRQTERFPPVAGQVIELTPSTNQLQCFDFNNDGRTDIVTIDKDGLKLYQFRDEKFDSEPRHLAKENTIYAGGIEGMMLPHSIIYTLDGRPVAFIPIRDGLALYEIVQPKLRELARIKFPPRMRRADRSIKLFGNDPGFITMAIPDIHLADATGDGRDDIYLEWPDRITIFGQNENGGFNNDDHIDFRFQETDSDNLCQAHLVDYDRDGRLDLICCRSGGGITGAVTDIDFFGSDRIRSNSHEPSHSLNISDAVGNLMITDVDGNGNPELVVSAVEIGTMSTVQMMITNKTDFHVLVYPIDNLGRPAREPLVRREITCRLDFSLADPTAGIRCDWSEDFNGDGWEDFVFADGGGMLMFYSGKADEYIEKKAGLAVEMEDPDFIYPVRLNGDNKADLIIIHKATNDKARLTLLITNRIG